MPPESKAKKQQRAIRIAKLLNKRYKKAQTELQYYNDPFKLVIAVALSAQTTDKAVNKVTKILWEKYPDAKSLSQAKTSDVEKILRPIGFYHNKAKNCIACAKTVVEKYNGNVPQTMQELTCLAGVGRKTANIILNVAFDKVEGIAVDTHVFRITQRLKLSNAHTPAKAEFDLLDVFPKIYWKYLNHQLVLFGREICTAKHPNCDMCPLCSECPTKK